MPDSIRSATVRLEAQVAKYIADMERAGKATDDAFKSSSVSAKRLDKDISGVSTRAQELGNRTSSLEGDFSRARVESDKLATSVQRVGTASSRTSAAQTKLSQDVEQTNRSMGRGQKGLDSYTDRLGLLVSAVGAVGPGLVPLGGLAIGGLAGLANDAGAAAVAGGSLIVAFHGVGKALEAVNKAALDPTTANLAAAKLQMEQLSPATRQFVREFQDMRPLLAQVQAAAASGWFPGLDTALKELRPLAPVIGKIFHDVGTMGGKLAAEGAKALAGPQWAQFFTFIDQQAPRAMAALGKVVGSLAHGLAGLWMAFSPVDNGFNRWLVDAAHSFDQWANGLSKTQGFQDFVSYLQTNGPKVGQALGAIGDALIQIVQAAAPLGGPTLDALTGIAKVLGAIADSPLGTPIMAIIQLASAMRLLKAATGGLGSARSGLTGMTMIGPSLDRALPSMTRFRAGLTGMRAGLKEINSLGGGPLNLFNSAARTSSAEAERFGKGLRGMAVEGGKALAPIAAVGLATSGVADKFGLSNTATLALAGSIAGPFGTAVGAGAGLAIDFASAASKASTSLQQMNAAVKSTDLTQVNTQLAAANAAQADFLKHSDSSGNLLDNLGDGFYLVTHGAKGYQEQVSELTVRSEDLAQKQLGVSRSFVTTAHAAGMTTTQLAQLVAQTNAQKDAALGAFGANNAYRDSLAAAAKQAATNNAGIRGMSADARANSDALATLAGAWNQNLAAMQSNGASMVAMRGKTATARAAFIKTAEAMGVPTKAAEVLASKLLHIPPKVNTNVKLTGVPAALAELDHLRSLISGNPITQSVVVQRVGQVPGHNVSVGSPNLAGTLLGVPQTHHKADGGLMRGPGGPRDDLIPAMLSNREYVMPAATVDHYGVGFMDSLRSRQIATFASGGSAGGISTTATSSKHHNWLTPSELSTAVQSLVSSMSSLFGGGTSTPGGQAIAAMNTFAATIKKDGGHVGDSFGLLSKKIAANATQYDRLNTKLQDLVATQQSLVDGVKQSFTTDVFNQSPDLSSLTFGGGRSFSDMPQWLQDSYTKQAQTSQYANIPSQLATDSASAAQYAAELERMRKNLGKGYADIAGSNDKGFVDWLSHQSAAVQKQYGQAFASRDANVQRAATSVGAGMGPMLAAVRSEMAGLRADYRAEMKELRAEVRGTVSHKHQLEQADLTGAAVGKAVNGVGSTAKTKAKVTAATNPRGRR